MGRIWSLLFLTVPIVGTGAIVWAMAGIWPLDHHWLPENINEPSLVIDNLFMFILYLTGTIFVGTGLLLFWFTWKYDAERNTEPVKYMHGSHTLEVVWSILPAAVLLFIAIYQMNAWADARMRRPTEGPGADQIVGTADDELKPPLALIKARQFEWRIQYTGKDRLVGTPDDIFTVNELHVPVNEEIVLQIESEDVLHSFFLPNARLKQDVVPGMRQFVWFLPSKLGRYDIVCAELCGWGHYKMKGRLTVESADDFNSWLAAEQAKQEQSSFSASEGEE